MGIQGALQHQVVRDPSPLAVAEVLRVLLSRLPRVVELLALVRVLGGPLRLVHHVDHALRGMEVDPLPRRLPRSLAVGEILMKEKKFDVRGESRQQVEQF